MGRGIGSSGQCGACSKPVYAAESVRIGDSLYHRLCLKCMTCSLALSVSTCHTSAGKPYCRVHLPVRTGSMTMAEHAAAPVAAVPLEPRRKSRVRGEDSSESSFSSRMAVFMKLARRGEKDSARAEKPARRGRKAKKAEADAEAAAAATPASAASGSEPPVSERASEADAVTKSTSTRTVGSALTSSRGGTSEKVSPTTSPRMVRPLKTSPEGSPRVSIAESTSSSKSMATSAKLSPDVVQKKKKKKKKNKKKSMKVDRIETATSPEFYDIHVPSLPMSSRRMTEPDSSAAGSVLESFAKRGQLVVAADGWMDLRGGVTQKVLGSMQYLTSDSGAALRITGMPSLDDCATFSIISRFVSRLCLRDFNEASIIPVLKAFHGLEHLKLVRTKLTCGGCEDTVASITKLELIETSIESFMFMSLFSDSLEILLVESCDLPVGPFLGDLKHVEIFELRDVFAAGGIVLPHLPSARRVVVDVAAKVDACALASSPFLRNLILSNIGELVMPDQVTVRSWSGPLRSINLNNSNISSPDVEFSLPTSLRDISLRHSNLTAISMLQNTPLLERLDLSGNRALDTDMLARVLRECQMLRQLDMSDVELHDAEVLEELPVSLEALYTHSIYPRDPADDGEMFVEAFARRLPDLVNLQQLSLWDNFVLWLADQSDFSTVDDLVNLREVIIGAEHPAVARYFTEKGVQVHSMLSMGHSGAHSTKTSLNGSTKGGSTPIFRTALFHLSPYKQSNSEIGTRSRSDRALTRSTRK